MRSYAQFIATRMHIATFHVCLCLLALTFVCNSTYLLKCSFQIYQKRQLATGNLQRNFTLNKRCKLVANVWYVKTILANRDGNVYLPILHLPRVEYRCKLQEKLHLAAPQRHSATAPQRHSATAPQRHSATAPQRHSATAPQRHSATAPQRHLTLRLLRPEIEPGPLI